MTFRLANYGRRTSWLNHEWIYHTWHPGQAGAADIGGPHDGRNFSLRTLALLHNGRVEPWAQNVAVAASRAGATTTRPDLLEQMLATDRREWIEARHSLTAVDPVELVAENVDGYNIVRDKALFVGLHQSEGPYIAAKLVRGEYGRFVCGKSADEVAAAIRRTVPTRQNVASALRPVPGAPAEVDRVIERPGSDRRDPWRPDRGSPIARSRLLTNLGWRFYHHRLYTEARRAFERAAVLDPSNNRAMSGQAWTSLQLQQLDRALVGFNAVLAGISPGDRDAWQEALRGRAWTECRSHAYEQAITDFTQALDFTDPSYRAVKADILRGRSRAHFMCGRTPDAVADFRASRGRRSMLYSRVAVAVGAYAASLDSDSLAASTRAASLSRWPNPRGAPKS